MAQTKLNSFKKQADPIGKKIVLKINLKKLIIKNFLFESEE